MCGGGGHSLSRRVFAQNPLAEVHAQQPGHTASLTHHVRRSYGLGPDIAQVVTLRCFFHTFRLRNHLGFPTITGNLTFFWTCRTALQHIGCAPSTRESGSYRKANFHSITVTAIDLWFFELSHSRKCTTFLFLHERVIAC